MTAATSAARKAPALPLSALARRLAAECLGTGLLLAAVIGSSVMAERLAGGDAAMALFANAAVTGAALVVIITVFAPVSGAHLNPAVTLVFALRREIAPLAALAYGLAQIVGAVIGVWTAHLMFAEPALQLSSTARDGAAQALSEAVATFGLVLAILGTRRSQPGAIPAVVGLYIAAAYWFTASTSFANPAATLARTLTDSPPGVAPLSAPVFVAVEFAAAVLASGFCRWLFEEGSER